MSVTYGQIRNKCISSRGTVSMVGVCEGNVCRVEGNFTLIIIYPRAVTLCQLPVTGYEVSSQIFLNL